MIMATLFTVMFVHRVYCNVCSSGDVKGEECGCYYIVGFHSSGDAGSSFLAGGVFQVKYARSWVCRCRRQVRRTRHPKKPTKGMGFILF